MVRYKIRLFYNATKAIVKIQEKYKIKEMIIIQKQKYIISKQTQKNMINFLYQRPSIKHENNYQCHTGFILEEEIFKEFIANFDFSSYEKYEGTLCCRIKRLNSYNNCDN